MPPKKKKGNPRPRDRAISLLGVAESIAVGEIISRGTVGVGLFDFFTDGWGGAGATRKAQGPNQISLYEMIYGNTLTTPKVYTATHGTIGGSGTVGGTTLQVVENNLRSSGWRTAGGLILVPFGFRMLKRAVTKSGLRTNANKLFKMVGVRNEVKM
jgi:hypothetical protein